MAGTTGTFGGDDAAKNFVGVGSNERRMMVIGGDCWICEVTEF